MTQRTRSRFSWDAVPAWLVTAMLDCAYRSGGQAEQLDGIARLRGSKLRDQARRSLGEPPQQRYFDEAMVALLLRDWLPTASDETVVALRTVVQAGMRGDERRRTFRSTAGQVRFLQQHRSSPKIRKPVRDAFVKAHKVAGAPVAGPGAPGRKRSTITLSGAGDPGRQPYDHQEQAWAALDAAPAPVRGVIVLPTGAGKTDTAATWLLRRMAADPQVRVLWLAHQQELVDQSVRRFQALARNQPAGFERRARVIHSAGSEPFTLSDDDLDLAGITIQSLGRLLGLNPEHLARFLGRPTYVVVDEAHHAGSPTYCGVLDHLIEQPSVLGVIGLTATPYPSAPWARRSFERYFPTRFVDARREDLIAARILARPTLEVLDTGTTVLLSGRQRDQAVASDLPPDALRKVVSADRDALLLRTWQSAPRKWGKTLFFATSIEHADSLGSSLDAAKVPNAVLHSASVASTGEVLRWFKDHDGPCVLVSVGMLTEGVDLPDARTAFLARPTTSRILMQQMIGRVLRGPRAGGDPEAHLVYLRDRWENFGDVLEPGEVVGGMTAPPNGDRPLPPIVVDDGRELSPEVAATVERLIRQARRSAVLDDDDPHNDRSLDPQLTVTALAGYYDLGAELLPVFEHQRQGFIDLIADADADWGGTGFLTYFNGEPPPFPTRRSVRALVEYVRADGEPPFVELAAPIGPESAATALLAAGPLTAVERRRLIRDHYDTSLNRHSWTSFDHFEQAVDAEVRTRLDGGRRLDAERLRFDPVGSERLPRRRRPLKPLVAQTVQEAKRLLPSEHAERLDDPPPVFWTPRVITSSWAHWTIALGTKGAGRQQIRINRILRTEPRHFPDEALRYLIFHELLHHLLPGQGHDAEFRELEQSWPDADRLDLLFATLHETWDLDPKRYERDIGGQRDDE